MEMVCIHSSKRCWNYTPAMQLYHRMLVVAVLDAHTSLANGSPSDDALLARDWIATSATLGSKAARSEYISFAQCCEAIDIHPDTERVRLLAAIDAKLDFDTDDAWRRLEDLQSVGSTREPKLQAPLPAWSRVVPILDQLSLFALSQAA